MLMIIQPTIGALVKPVGVRGGLEIIAAMLVAVHKSYLEKEGSPLNDDQGICYDGSSGKLYHTFILCHNIMSRISK